MTKVRAPFPYFSETVLKIILIYGESKLIINLSYDEDLLSAQDLFTYSFDPKVSPAVC